MVMTLTQLRAELFERRPNPVTVESLLANYVVDAARVEEYKQHRIELCPDWETWDYSWFIHQGRQLVLSEEVTA
jgi:hypothetical protein